MCAIWVIGDTHFYHERIIRYENRPFESVEEMNQALINNWNSKVKKNDKIFMLGDFSLCTKLKMEGIVRQLNGYKVLIIGNHDTYSPAVYVEAGFAEAYRYPIIYDGFWILSHEPMYINSNMPYANIFAHVHGNPEYRDYSQQTFCASVERKALNYSPIRLDEVKKLMQTAEK